MVRGATYCPDGIPAINISSSWGFLDEGGSGLSITATLLHLLHIHLCSKKRKADTTHRAGGNMGGGADTASPTL